MHLFRTPHPERWLSGWTVILIWILVLMLPDAVASLRVHLSNPPLRASSDRWTLSAAGERLDCTWIRSRTELRTCLEGASSSMDTAAPRLIYLPARWSELEPEPGAWHWSDLDDHLDLVQAHTVIPVLVMDDVPEWVIRGSQLWGRDDPTLVSSHPQRFAAFAAALARRYDRRVMHYQLGTTSNLAAEPFPFAASPVRYGQMAMRVSAAMRRSGTHLCLLSAPLLPAAGDEETAQSPAAWMKRLRATGAWNVLDIIQWQPSPPRADSEPAFALLPHAHPPVGGEFQQSGSSLHWRFLQPARHEAAGEDGMGARAYEGISWVPRHTVLQHAPPASSHPCLLAPPHLVQEQTFPEPHRNSPGWLLPLCMAAYGLGLRRLMRHGNDRRDLIPISWVSRLSPSALNWLCLLLISGALILALAFPQWPLVSLMMVILLWVTALRPDLSWLTALLVLPFDYIHLDLTSPLSHQPFSLSLSHVMVMALCPSLGLALYRSVRAWMAARGRKPLGISAGMLIGWGILIATGSLGRPAETRLSVVALHDLYPWLLGAITLWQTRSRHDVRRAMTALALGTTAFALVGLAPWLLAGLQETMPPARLAGLTFSPNHAAMLLERGLWLAIALMAMASFPVRQAWMLGSAGLGVALLLTWSRGALGLGLPAAILVMGLGLTKHLRRGDGNRRRFLATCLPVLGLALGGAVWAASLGQGSPAARITDWEPIATRWDIWRFTGSVIRLHPWLGMGSDGFYWAAARTFPPLPRLNPEIAHPHNLGLEVWVRWGALGLAWMGGWILVVYARILRTPRGTAVPWLILGFAAALTAGLVHSLVDAYWSLPDVAAHNLILWVLLDRVTRPAKKEPGAIAPGSTRPAEGHL